MESLRLEREKVPAEQKIRTLTPLLVHSLEKVVSRKPVKSYSNYHKAEVSFSQKYKQIKSMIELAKVSKKMRPRGEEASPTEVQNFIAKFLKIIKSLRPEEIKVFKQKAKE